MLRPATGTAEARPPDRSGTCDEEEIRMKRIGMMIALLALALSVTRAAASPAYFYFYYDFTTSVQPFGAAAMPANMLTAYTLLHEVDPVATDGIVPIDAPANGYAALSNTNGATAVYMAAKAQGGGEMVRVSFQAKDLYGCGRCAVIGYVGEGLPIELVGFTKLGMLKTGWTDYTFDVPTQAQTVVVAIGILNLDMTKKLQRAGVDNVEIQFLGDQ
jgi:hypothetical protein